MNTAIKTSIFTFVLALSSLPITSLAATTVKKPATPTPYVKAISQALVKNTVIIKELYSPADGWIVLHQSLEHTPSMVIGHAAVKKGVNKDVTVTIDRPKDITPKLFAMLHSDKGKKGKFEFPPGIDNPVAINHEPVMMEFSIVKK